MRVIESALLEEGEVLIQSRVRKVLELIGVRNLYPLDIIKHHILPQFTTGTWKVNNNIHNIYWAISFNSYTPPMDDKREN